jgi:signal transduction histidine kinase
MVKRDTRWVRPPGVKAVIAFSALIMLMVCLLITWQAFRSYETAFEEGKRNAERLSTIMSDQIQLSFLSVDLTMQRVIERWYFDQLFGGTITEDVENNLRLWVDETPQIAALLLIDQTGTTRVAAFKRGYQNRILYASDFSAHPLFQELQDDDTGNYAVTAQHDGDYELILTGRRIDTVDGGFGGMVMAVIDPNAFTDFFISVEGGSHRFMVLMNSAGETLFTGKARSVHEKDETIDVIKAQLPTLLPDTRLPVSDHKKIDGSIKIFSFQQLGHLPVWLSIVIDESDFLSEWRSSRLKDASFLAIFTIFGSVLSYFALAMAKQIMRVEASESSAILASQAKSEFLANMSHELRTPLNAIIGFSEMINAGYFGDLNDKQRERIHDINLCGSHLLQLINDILEFSKGEAGKLELHEEEMDVGQVMEECARIIKEKARSKHITLAIHAPEHPLYLRADRRKMRQILLNLLSNAIKFTPEHGTITLAASHQPGRQIHIAVTDTGIGIPEDEIQKALSVFGQVHRNQSHEGTGLGLPLCKMFVELHGGTLSLQSKVGQGTTVTIRLPEERLASVS